ncbi:MAG: hypothetical protein WCL44_02620 [bacterium]
METSNPSFQTSTATLVVRWAFCLAVAMVALWRLSENTADPDLWGHVLFGQRMLDAACVDRTEPFSWTAPGHPWINHEVGAEIVMGAVHRFAGGTGLLLLMVLAGALTMGLALKLGTDGLAWPQRAAAWGIAGLLAKEVAFGFAARPQIFTAIALVLMILLLRRAHSGSQKWLMMMPLLFVVWVNMHGGAVAGICLLGLAAAATTAQWLWARRLSFAPAFRSGRTASQRSAPFHGPGMEPTLNPVMLWVAATVSAAALLCNPWGCGLLNWLVESVLWLRPEISEWNPPGFGVDHLPMFALIPLSILAFATSRRSKAWWEPAVLLALGMASLRLQRHIPLFCIAAIAIVPPHLADSVDRFKDHLAHLRRILARTPVKWALSVALITTAAAAGGATMFHNKRDFTTMEVPRDEYPVAAADFIRRMGLSGNLLVSFDWGEFAIWELPDSRVSMDGRLDTCYPHDLIREHWRFYEGEKVDETVLDISRADLALIESFCPGSQVLRSDPAWKLVYRDPLAAVWVRNPGRFHSLDHLTGPAAPPRELTRGREPFPSRR